MDNYMKNYYQKNKRKIKQQAICWQKNNKKRFLGYQRTWRKEANIKYPLRKRLSNIKQRCEYPRDKKYKYYGGRGIKCLLSMADLQFLWDRDKAGLMEQPSIHRRDNQKDYCIENCQFIEMYLNRKNIKEGSSPMKQTLSIYITLTGDKAKEAEEFKKKHPEVSHPYIYMKGIEQVKKELK